MNEEKEYKVYTIIFADLIIGSLMGLLFVAFTFLTMPLFEWQMYFVIWAVSCFTVFTIFMFLEFYFHIRRWKYVKKN